jgi:hypothetical protein
MTELIESIQAAVQADASPEIRATGVMACKTILAALEAQPGQPIATAAPFDTSKIASVVGALRGVSPDQLLDLAIAKLRSVLPAGSEVPKVEPLKFHLIQIPRVGG